MRLVLGSRAPFPSTTSQRRYAHAPRVGMGDQVVSSALVIEKSQHQGQEDDNVVISSAAGWSMSSNERALLPPDELIYQQDALHNLRRKRQQPQQQLLHTQLQPQVYINGQHSPVAQQVQGDEPVQASLPPAKPAAPASPPAEDANPQGASEQLQGAGSSPDACAAGDSTQLPHLRRHRVRRREASDSRLAPASPPPHISLDAALAQLDELLQSGTHTAASTTQATVQTRAVERHSNTPHHPQHSRSSKQLLRAVQTAADISRAHELWCQHQQRMQPHHTTAMWCRLSELVAGQGSTPASSLHSSTGQQQQQPPVSGEAGGSYKQAALADLAHRESALRAVLNPCVMSLWGELQHTTRFMAPECSIAQVADILHAHAQLQHVLQQLATMQYKLHQVQRPKNSYSQQSGGHKANGVAVKGAVGNTGATHQHSDAAQVVSRVEAVDSSVRLATDTRTHATVLPAFPKRSRSEVVALQHQHRQFVGDLLRLCTPQLQSATCGQLVLLLTCTVGLKYPLPKLWMDAWWSASLPLLPSLTTNHMQAMFRGVGHSGLQPPPAWCIALYAASKPQLASATVPALCVYAHGAARLATRPGGAWLSALMSACEEQFDSLDAPAYALLLHALGRMRARPPVLWMQEFWDNSQGLLYDFTTQELCLLMKGAAYLGIAPEPDWQRSLWQESRGRLRSASASQLSGLGWAVLVGLGLKPPRNWVTAWLSAMHRSCMTGNTTSAPLKRGAAVRAVQALAVLQVEDLPQWCTRLRVPQPAARPAAGALAATSGAAASEGALGGGGGGGGGEAWGVVMPGAVDGAGSGDDEGSAHDTGVSQGYAGSEAEEDMKMRVAALQAAW